MENADGKIIELMMQITDEFTEATNKFGAFNSTHEGYAVIQEELDELWDAVKSNDPVKAIVEAKQVGAMALRFMYDIGNMILAERKEGK